MLVFAAVHNTDYPTWMKKCFLVTELSDINEMIHHESSSITFHCLDVRGTSYGHPIWDWSAWCQNGMSINLLLQTLFFRSWTSDLGSQATISKFGQNLTFSRHCWRPQDVHGTSESHILVRIWHVHLWSDPDICKTFLMSTGHPRDVRTLVLCPWTGPGMTDSKVLAWLESDFIHPSQFLASRGLPGDAIFWH